MIKLIWSKIFPGRAPSRPMEPRTLTDREQAVLQQGRDLFQEALHRYRAPERITAGQTVENVAMDLSEAILSSRESGVMLAYLVFQSQVQGAKATSVVDKIGRATLEIIQIKERRRLLKMEAGILSSLIGGRNPMSLLRMGDGLYRNLRPRELALADALSAFRGQERALADWKSEEESWLAWQRGPIKDRPSFLCDFNFPVRWLPVHPGAKFFHYPVHSMLRGPWQERVMRNREALKANPALVAGLTPEEARRLGQKYTDETGRWIKDQMTKKYLEKMRQWTETAREQGVTFSDPNTSLGWSAGKETEWGDRTYIPEELDPKILPPGGVYERVPLAEGGVRRVSLNPGWHYWPKTLAEGNPFLQTNAEGPPETGDSTPQINAPEKAIPANPPEEPKDWMELPVDEIMWEGLLHGAFVF